MSWPWSQLGLPGPSSLSEVRHAYAEKLKTTHPEDDPEGFQRLHSAYQLASRMAREQRRRRPYPQAEETKSSRSGTGEDEVLDAGLREEQDFDYEEFLQGGEEAPRSRQEEEQDFDFEELLQGGEAPRSHQEEKRDFDFDRLFAEGEAERAEARRRRGEERRKAKERERRRHEEDRRGRFRQEQARWQDTETILHTIEMLYTAGAAPEAWQKFFASPLFQKNRGSLDLIFGLEDFISGHPDLDREVKTALYRVYGFEQSPARPELRPLYQMLLPAWRAEEKERRQKQYKVWSILGGLLLAPVMMALLAIGWILPLLLLAVCLVLIRSVSKGGRGLGLLWLLALGGFTWLCLDRGWGLKPPLSILAIGFACWTVSHLIHSVRQDERSEGRPGNKKDEQLIAVFTAACLILGVTMLFMPELRQGMGRFSAPRDPREEVCRWLEEDYGAAFRSLYNENSSSRFDNVFALAEEADKLFLAGPDGERSAEEGKPGYTTNYPDMRVLWAMEDFGAAHGLHDVDLMNRNQSLASWDTSGVYLVILPFYGAGETITDLGACLEELAGEDWYRLGSPSFKVVLCSEQLNDGRLILEEYESASGSFDAGAARALYEESFAQAYCAQLLRDCKLDRDFTRSDSAQPYTLADGGAAQIKGNVCYQLLGLDAEGQTAMEYYISTAGGTVCNIFCVPGGFWEAGGREEDLHFYRMVHREAGLGLVYLHYPWLTKT